MKKILPEYRKTIEYFVSTRRAHRISQWDIAEEVGRSVQWVGNIERLHRIVSPEIIVTINSALCSLIAERQRRKEHA